MWFTAKMHSAFITSKTELVCSYIFHVSSLLFVPYCCTMKLYVKAEANCLGEKYFIFLVKCLNVSMKHRIKIPTCKLKILVSERVPFSDAPSLTCTCLELRSCKWEPEEEQTSPFFLCSSWYMGS